MTDFQSTDQAKQEETLSPEAQEIKRLTEAYDDMMGKMLKGGLSPKDALEVNPQTLENVYAQAYRLYNTGKYDEALQLFRILVVLNAMEPKYILGLAASFHLLKEYQNAIQSYTLCSTLDPKSPLPSYHSADCFIQMKDDLSAMVCLEMAIERAGNQPEYAKIKERALLSLAHLKKQLASTSSSNFEA